MVLVVAGTTQPEALLQSVPFPVETLSAFLLEDQSFVTYVPGAPRYVNEPFTRSLQPDQVIWMRLPEGQREVAVQWVNQSLASKVPDTGARPLKAPKPGGLTVGVAGNATVQELIQAQPFSVASVLFFDPAVQEFRSYVVGAPDYANTLPTAASLSKTSIVWMRRSYADAPVNPVTPIEPQSPSTPASVPSAGGPAATATPAAAAPKPTATPSASKPAAVAPPVKSGAGLDRHVTYEGGRGKEEPHTATRHALGDAPVARSGEKAGMALLKPGDPKWHAGGYRAEWHAHDHVYAGTERWQGISFYFPKDYNQGRNGTWNDRIIFQYTDEGSPMWSLHIDAARQQLFVRHKTSTGGKQSFEEIARWSFSTDRWYDIAFHAKWSQGRDGLFEVYVNGEREASYKGRTLMVRNFTYSKWGIYGQPTKLYFDEIRIAEGANRLGDVTP